VLRFIPTHVGNTNNLSSLPPSVPVHPHACGEHISSMISAISKHGSSPRMWGTRIARTYYLIPGRFIPTHVGNTTNCPRSRSTDAVHPHACGEHLYLLHYIQQPGGSSPRMWGTRPTNGIHDKLNRFIPTHVGNTVLFPRLLPPYTVHPHACGEH